MLTGLKVSYLACKYVFYKPEHHTRGELHGINEIDGKNEIYQRIESKELMRKMVSFLSCFLLDLCSMVTKISNSIFSIFSIFC